MRVLSFRDLCMPKLAPLELPGRPEMALQGYSESVTDVQAFSIDLEKLFTLSANQSSSWIGLINRLRPDSISQLWDNLNSWIEEKFFQHIYFFTWTLNSAKNHDEEANSSSKELRMSTRNTPASTASHKDRYYTQVDNQLGFIYNLIVKSRGIV